MWCTATYVCGSIILGRATFGSGSSRLHVKNVKDHRGFHLFLFMKLIRIRCRLGDSARRGGLVWANEPGRGFVRLESQVLQNACEKILVLLLRSMKEVLKGSLAETLERYREGRLVPSDWALSFQAEA